MITVHWQLSEVSRRLRRNAKEASVKKKGSRGTSLGRFFSSEVSLLFESNIRNFISVD